MTSEGRVCLGLADVKRYGVTEEIVLTEQLDLLLFTVFCLCVYCLSKFQTQTKFLAPRLIFARNFMKVHHNISTVADTELM